MNDDLKAYVDGELPPDAAELLRARLDVDPELALEGEGFRRLSAALRALPEPMPVGQAATLEALARRQPLWRGWTAALAGCAAVLLAVSTLPSRATSAPAVQTAVFVRESEDKAPDRRAEFDAFLRGLGGKTEPTSDGFRAEYPRAAHRRVLRKFALPEDLPWKADGIDIRTAD